MKTEAGFLIADGFLITLRVEGFLRTAGFFMIEGIAKPNVV